MPISITIPVGICTKNRLDLRSTGSVLLVDEKLADSAQTPQILASSPAGCQALAEVLLELAAAYREREAEWE